MNSRPTLQLFQYLHLTLLQ